MEDGIVVADRVWPVFDGFTREPVRVRTWHDGELPRVAEFYPGDGYNKKRTHPIDLGIIHWTGGESAPERVLETLRARKLGVEFLIPRLGEIWQMCDPAFVDTADVGLLNYRSFGVEVVCFGFAGFTFADPLRTIRVPFVPKLGKDRETYVAATHGRKVKTANFYPEQLGPLLGLCDAMAEACGIPRQVPPEEFDDKVFPDLLLRDPAKRFKGFAGHYHATKKKRDPGPLPIQSLRQHFQEAA